MEDENGSGGDGGEKAKRPNANYRLSRTNENPKPEDIVHRYDRERRLEKAPQSVRDLYLQTEARPRRGLFRGAGGRTQIFTMIAILLVSVFALVSTILGRDGQTHLLDGNRISVQAIRYESMVIMALRKTEGGPRPPFSFGPRRAAYTGPVGVEIRPSPGESGSVFFHRIDFTGESPEFFRFTVPFDAPELLVVLEAGNSSASATVVVE